MTRDPMSYRAATASLAMLVCLAVFVMGCLPFMPSRFFAFSVVLLCIGGPVGFLVPSFDKSRSSAMVDIALGLWLAWIIIPTCYSTMLVYSGSQEAMVYIVWLAMLVYAFVVLAISALLRSSESLRRFSTVSDDENVWVTKRW